MGAVTYPDPEVEKYIEQHFIPVQFNVVDQPDVMERFNTPWTPTLIVQDADGKEHGRSQGYLDPKRFLAEMALVRLKEPINRRDFATARDRVRDVLARVAGDPQREPEAIYWGGVAAYKASNDANHLMAGWNRLLDEFPQSEWARKVAFIRM
jgi:hypothetical protein